jgi:hypothetical protein
MSGLLGRLLSRRQAATVPSMDGVLRPNEALDGAPVLTSAREADNLVLHGSTLVYSKGNDILGVTAESRDQPGILQHRLDGAVTALAAGDGMLVAGVEGVGIEVIGGAHNGTVLRDIGGRAARCITALTLGKTGILYAAIGSAQNEARAWQRDLMEMRATGSVWRIDLGKQTAVCLADRLAFPNGLLVQGETLIVSESWGHRLLRIGAHGKNDRREIVLEDLPGYPGRLAPASGGGAWLAIFAPRSQLIEFVLRETTYRKRMLREVPQDLWIAPTLRSGVSFKEPMQGGAVKVHGIFKPWAPTRSYGLVVELDAGLAPVRSFHSRADGNRHGVVSVCEWAGEVVFASRGNGVICALPASQSNVRGPSPASSQDPSR